MSAVMIPRFGLDWRSLVAGVALATLACAGHARAVDVRDWDAVVAAARGQTVYFNAWGGEPRINDYIAWAGDQVHARYGVTVEHVKLADTAHAVARVLAEKAAGRRDDGSVDLMWINGENFAAMKENGLLFGPWSSDLPNYRYVDVAGKPTITVDFTVPVEGLEAPWGMAQIVFYYDTAYVAEPPADAHALLAWAEANPGRFTYPQVPNFLGSTFLKQILYGVVADPARLQAPASDADFARVSEPLWRYLDALHPHLWRSARAFPQNSAAQRALMSDGEIDIAISFNPLEASSAILSDELPESVRTFVFEGGTIGNTSFVAIPFNAAHKEGALVLANFLLSPEAQARKQDPKVWGNLTVLDLEALPAEERARFDAIALGPGSLPPDELGRPLLEPHPTWMTRIEGAWLARYGVAH